MAASGLQQLPVTVSTEHASFSANDANWSGHILTT